MRGRHIHADSQYVLVEFMPSVSYEILFQGIRKLVSNGYTPILAHMERYGCLRKKGTSELLDIGCKLQMNYDSIQGHWFSPEVRWCREQVKSGSDPFPGDRHAQVRLQTASNHRGTQMA